MHPILEKILQDTHATLPVIIDELQTFELVSIFSGIQVTSYEECVTGSISGVYLYEKSLEKKHLSIEDIRRWLSDIYEIPYERKNIYILRDFDESTPEAMNASLKILEEPPQYAIILLVVKNPESLIETIRSRSLNYYRGTFYIDLSEDIRDAIHHYHKGNTVPLLLIIYKEKIEASVATSILLELAKNADEDMLESILTALISLHSVNETPRNILDRVVLSKYSPMNSV